MSKLSVLLIEDDEDDFILTQDLFNQAELTRFELAWVDNYDQALPAMIENRYDVYLVDYRLGAHNGLNLLQEAIKEGCSSPIIFITGQNDRDVDVAALSAGAADYLIKDTVTAPMLERAIRYALERKQVQQAIINSRNTIRAFMDASSEIMILVDKRYTIVTLNAAAAIYLGQPILGLIDQPLFQWWPKNSLLPQKLDELITQSRAMAFNMAQGNAWYQMSCAPIFDSQQQVRQIAIIAREITAQKQAEQALELAYQRLRVYVENSPLVVIEWDTAFRVARWSDEAEELFGWSAIDLYGKHPDTWQFVLTEDQPAFTAIIESLLDETTASYVAINGHYTKTGSVIYCEWYISALFDDLGHLTGFLSLVLDVTERRQAEIALRQERATLAERVAARTYELHKTNLELQRAVRLKDEFLANMSHELRTPLNAILGMSEVLKEETFGPLTKQQLKYLTTIENSGSHLLRLINDILDLSKLEAGMFEIHPTTIYVQQLSEIVLQFVRQQALKKQINVQVDIDPEVIQIEADELRLKQILVNLLSNAVKFTETNGEIGLRIAGDKAHQLVYFGVWDTGPGIPTDRIPDLFEPFVQLDGGLNRSQEGTGLGLSLVYRLVKLHGGSIAVDSTVGTGSTFTISLDWYATSSPPPKDNKTPTVSPNQPDRSTKVILLVEDNLTNIEVMADYLQGVGYCVEVAEHGQAAISQAKALNPNLIIMDVHMPGMDGLEATRQIRLIPQLVYVPIIAVTALTMPGDRDRCLEAGMNAYMSKPVKLKNLVTLIDSYLT